MFGKSHKQYGGLQAKDEFHRANPNHLCPRPVTSGSRPSCIVTAFVNPKSTKKAPYGLDYLRRRMTFIGQMEAQKGEISEETTTRSSITQQEVKSPRKQRKRRQRKTDKRIMVEEEENMELFESNYIEYEDDEWLYDSSDEIARRRRNSLISLVFNLKENKIKPFEALGRTRRGSSAKRRKSAKKSVIIAEEKSGPQLDVMPLVVEELLEEIELEVQREVDRMAKEEQFMKLRVGQLTNTNYHFNQLSNDFNAYTLERINKEKWAHYLSCDGLPDPSILQDLNRFLYLWSFEDSIIDMKTMPRLCEIMVYLLKQIDEVINYSVNVSPTYIKECKKSRLHCRNKLQYWIDLASYALLRNIERDSVKVDLKNAKYIEQISPLVCCIWAFIKLPISMKIPTEKERRPVEVQFEELIFTVSIPIDIDCYCTAVRVVWYGYDHYSEQANSSEIPPLPTELQQDMDLLSFCQAEYDYIVQVRKEQQKGRAKRLEERRRIVNRLLTEADVPVAPTKPTKSSKKGTAKAKTEPQPERGLPYLPTPEEMLHDKEEETKKEVRRLYFTRCKKTEVNLRKYAILGGIYRVDLINQPPQPKSVREESYITTLQIPKGLEFVKFFRPYVAPIPAPDNERTPEVIEAEMRALEAAMEALVLVTLKLPDAVMWFEPPLVAHWVPENKEWSTEHIHDLKYNEEKQSITFRTGKLGIHGLACYRYVNLPFQNWELKPELGKFSQGGVILTIVGAIIQLEFLVREDLVSLHSLTGGGSTKLNSLLGQPMKLHELILNMRQAGCDVFPENDAMSYFKGLSMKHPLLVKHVEKCMGMLSLAYIISWSRWNVSRKYREIVIQMKEIHGCLAKEKSTIVMLMTPLQTTSVNCTEVSHEFNIGGLSGKCNKFYADIYQYAIHNSGIRSRIAIKDISCNLSITVMKLLEATKILTMSA